MPHRLVKLLLLTASAAILACRLVAAGAERLTLEYRAGSADDKVFRQLDVYPPQNGAKNVPVFIFVHGGAWVKGNKEHYRGIGERFSRQGILAILPDYRLSPAVQHPAHAEDVAAAVAWTFKHAAEYGGDAKKIYLAGHSAGGHLVALVATDPKYLAIHGLQPADLAGVIPISGIYHIEGMAAGGVHPPEYLQTIFGKDRAGWSDINPISHIKPAQTAGPGLPRMMVVWAGRDPPFIIKNGEALRDALLANHHAPTALEVEGANHSTVVWFLGKPGRPLSDAVFKFMDYLPPNP